MDPTLCKSLYGNISYGHISRRGKSRPRAEWHQSRQFLTKWLLGLFDVWCWLKGLILVSVAGKLDIWQQQLLYQSWWVGTYLGESCIASPLPSCLFCSSTLRASTGVTVGKGWLTPTVYLFCLHGYLVPIVLWGLHVKHCNVLQRLHFLPTSIVLQEANVKMGLDIQEVY